MPMKRREFLRFFLALPAVAFLDFRRVASSVVYDEAQPNELSGEVAEELGDIELSDELIEELGDIVYNVSTVETPFLSAVGRSHATYVWQEDPL